MSRLKIKRYYVDRANDGPLVRLRNRLTRRPVPMFPRNLQIQTVTGCNADCVFCPYGATHSTQPKGRMSGELFRKILDEAREHGVRRISPYLMNEPLLDPDIVGKIREINERVPKGRVVLTTNGNYLTWEVTNALLNLPHGLHELYVSVQGVDREAYEATMRGNMQLDRTIANVLSFTAEQRRRQRDRPKLWVTMVDTALIDAARAVEYWRSLGIACKYTRLENRGGHIADAHHLSPRGSMDFYDNCQRPFRQAYILFNGDMVLCCVDYSRRQILGNVARSSIREVWNGPIAWTIRKRYIDRDRAALPLCRNCRINGIREVAVEPRRLDAVTARRARPHAVPLQAPRTVCPAPPSDDPQSPASRAGDRRPRGTPAPSPVVAREPISSSAR
jgi:MoaA/NifB/PqqE/SkfB family radical SAM enzyme